MSPAGALAMADLFRALGRTEDERRIIESYVRESVRRNHAGYVATYLRDKGHADLVSAIVAK